LTAETRSHVLRIEQDNTDEVADSDALIPATGIIVGIGLTIMLWCLIILAIYWIRLSL
jgi:hypothetical protein